MNPRKETQPTERWEEEWRAACARRDVSQGALRLLRLLYDLAGGRETLRVSWTAIVYELRRHDSTVRGWRRDLDDAGIVELAWNLGPRGGTSRAPGCDQVAIRLKPLSKWRPEYSPAWIGPAPDPRQPGFAFTDDGPAEPPPALGIVGGGAWGGEGGMEGPPPRDEPPVGGPPEHEVARDLARHVARDVARDLARDLARPSSRDLAPNAGGETPRAGAGARRPSVRLNSINDDDDDTERTDGVDPASRSAEPDWEAVYREHFGRAWLALFGEETREGGRVQGREPTRSERETLMRLGAIAAERGDRQWLLEACEITRAARPARPLNFLKGTLARTGGLDVTVLYAMIDPLRVPARYLRRPEAAPNGEQPQRE